MNKNPMNRELLNSTLKALQNFRVRHESLDIPEDEDDVGCGGYGVVKMAVLDRGDGSEPQMVAVKQLRSPMDRSECIKTAFRLARELTVWGQLIHKNVLPLIGFYLSENLEHAWLISPYVSNGNIAEYLEKNQPDMAERLRLVTDTAEGLAYLHSLEPQVLHGDLKAYNVLVNGHRRAMLCDFGLAKVMGETPTGLTSTKALKGSFRYFSPELINDDEPIRSTHSDMWAWGCLALEILTGLSPYHTCKGELQVLLKITQCERPANLDDVELPPQVLAIVHACWEEIPSIRPSVHYCLDVLSQVHSSELKPVVFHARSRTLTETSLSSMSSGSASTFSVPDSPVSSTSRASSPQVWSPDSSGQWSSIYRAPYINRSIESVARARAPLRPALKMRKFVRFPPEDVQLVSVVEFAKHSRPIALSNLGPGGNIVESDTDGYISESSDSSWGPAAHASSESLSNRVIVLDGTATSDIPSKSSVGCRGYFSDGVTRRYVILESVALPALPGSEPSVLRGNVLVRNVAFDKRVAVRFTLDEWMTTSEVSCSYSGSFPKLPLPFSTYASAAFRPDTSPDPASMPDGDLWDRFTFSIKIRDMARGLPGKTMLLAIRYAIPAQRGWVSGGEWWDNNEGKNYQLAIKSQEKALSPYLDSDSDSEAELGAGFRPPSLFGWVARPPTGLVTRREIPKAARPRSNSFPRRTAQKSPLVHVVLKETCPTSSGVSSTAESRSPSPETSVDFSSPAPNSTSFLTKTWSMDDSLSEFVAKYRFFPPSISTLSIGSLFSPLHPPGSPRLPPNLGLDIENL